MTQKLGEENVLSIANSSNPFYLEYYTAQIDSAFEYNIENIDESINISEIRDLIKNSEKDYVLIAYANKVVPSEIHEYAKQKYQVIYFHERYFNSDVIVYAKGDKKRETTFETSYLSSLKWNVNRGFIARQRFLLRQHCFSPNEVKTLYALTYKDTLKNLVNERNTYLTISALLSSGRYSKS